jgi:hypothetical protein
MSNKSTPSLVPITGGDRHPILPKFREICRKKKEFRNICKIINSVAIIQLRERIL